jgi:hypothetical protein
MVLRAQLCAADESPAISPTSPVSAPAVLVRVLEMAESSADKQEYEGKVLNVSGWNNS